MLEIAYEERPIGLWGAYLDLTICPVSTSRWMTVTAREAGNGVTLFRPVLGRIGETAIILQRRNPTGTAGVIVCPTGKFCLTVVARPEKVSCADKQILFLPASVTRMPYFAAGSGGGSGQGAAEIFKLILACGHPVGTTYPFSGLTPLREESGP
jgi:hypothetical protein